MPHILYERRYSLRIFYNLNFIFFHFFSFYLLCSYIGTMCLKKIY
nr:MAG TPA: LytB-sulfur-cluster binding, oxidoreductase [Caudoviricetes sp.]